MIGSDLGTKYYHMQQYFDCTFVLKQDEKQLIFQWSRSERPLGAIGKNIISVVKWTFDEGARDMVDEIAGVNNINSSVVFVS